jgi:thymidylate synthase (FAD)
MRYIDYSKKKNGSELQFIKPLWVDNSILYKRLWRKNRIESEKDYFALSKKLKPQEARNEVYSDIKTDIIMKASLEEWKLIFQERCNKYADPEIRRVMIPLQEQFKKIYPTIF